MTDSRLATYVNRYCNEMHKPGITYDDGAYPAVARETIRELCKEGQQLADSGLSHPVLYYCYYDTFIRSGYDLFTYHFGARKKIGKAGHHACQSDPETHPLLMYTFCNEMRMRAKKEDKQKYIDEMHTLFPQIFYPKFIIC